MTGGEAHFVIWGCSHKRIRFGTQNEYESGKNQVTECFDYIDRLSQSQQVNINSPSGIDKCKAILKGK